MQVFDEDVMRTQKAVPDHETTARSQVDAPASRSTRDAASIMHLQRAVGNAGVAQLLQSDDDPHGMAGLVGSGGGSPLDTETRTRMESSIGADFSDVRVHTGGDADRSAKSLGAHAYTSGSDVVFAQGRYDPSSETGQKTLAHELTHVVQQRSGPVDGEMTDTGVKVSSPSDPFEQAAEANAERIVSGGPAPATPSAAPAGSAPVQREGAEEEEVQTLAVQREGAEEEEVQTLAVQRDEAVQREGEEEEEATG